MGGVVDVADRGAQPLRGPLQRRGHLPELVPAVDLRVEREVTVGERLEDGPHPMQGPHERARQQQPERQYDDEAQRGAEQQPGDGPSLRLDPLLRDDRVLRDGIGDHGEGVLERVEALEEGGVRRAGGHRVVARERHPRRGRRQVVLDDRGRLGECPVDVGAEPGAADGLEARAQLGRVVVEVRGGGPEAGRVGRVAEHLEHVAADRVVHHVGLQSRTGGGVRTHQDVAPVGARADQVCGIAAEGEHDGRDHTDDAEHPGADRPVDEARERPRAGRGVGHRLVLLCELHLHRQREDDCELSADRARPGLDRCPEGRVAVVRRSVASWTDAAGTAPTSCSWAPACC